MDEKKSRAKDQRLRRIYGITLEDYERMVESQQGVCKICLRPPVTLALSVDHDHKWRRLKLEVTGNTGTDESRWFIAYVKPDTIGPRSPYRNLKGVGETKNAAKSMLRRFLQLCSVRGALCHSCNTGLRKYRDNPDNLWRAADYLRRHQEGS